MTCREGCGACCIAPSISSPIPGMPQGKPAGVTCVQLLPDLRCAIFGQPQRPSVCSQFDADLEVCGNDRIEALDLLAMWERETGSLSMIDAGQASVR
ncbi:MAG: YkgJ family cysteine cluster protein [Natronospirillum sp.]